MQENWPHYQGAKAAAAILNDAGYEAYIIGGAVRDLLLEITPKDFDLVTNATPKEVLKLKGFEKSRFHDTSQAYGVTRVYIKVEVEDEQHEVELEIATYRRDIEAHMGRKLTKVAFSSLEDDLKRRDFTINALALDPATNQIVDQVGGLEDLRQRILRFIGDAETRIKEDPLRLLRAIRLKNQLGFEYDSRTAQAIIDAVRKGALQDIAVERIKFELSRMLTDRHRKFALADLDSFGVLKVLLPEVAEMKDVTQPRKLHAEGDVFRHTSLCLQYLPDIVSPRLAWATLLHDAGKPLTRETKEKTGDRIRFSGHHEAGALLARKVLKRLRFNNRFTGDVAWMVHYHMAIDDLPAMRPKRAANFMHHPAFADLLELHKADAHAAWSIGNNGIIDKKPGDFSRLEKMWSDFQKQSKKDPHSLKSDLKINGAWLMKELKLEPGPKLGRILEELETAYLDEKINDKKSAKELAKKLTDQRDKE